MEKENIKKPELVEKVEKVEKIKEKKYTLKQIIQIAGVLKHDKLFLEKKFENEVPKTLKEWSKLTGLNILLTF